MQRITVKLGATLPNPNTRNYDIVVGSGIIDQAGELLYGAGLQHKAVIISDTTIAGLYADRLQATLFKAGFDASIILIPPGEQQKSLDVAANLYTELTNLHAERTTPIVALGGGVVGDLAGFVAATYMRGVPLVQIPTTILAQSDSSIGGKVAVNHGKLKNKIGAFYHPMVTISDVSLLRTLNERAVSDGLAEVIKHGIILDAVFFDYLEHNIDKIKSMDEKAMEHVIATSARIKADIVAKDELDLSLRNILNYGHTVGHAIESVSDLSIWHGEAVAIGMVAEAWIAEKLGLLTQSDVSRITNLLVLAGLPVQVPTFDRKTLMEVMTHDKKITGGKIRLALPKGIGEAVVTEAAGTPLLRQALDA